MAVVAPRAPMRVLKDQKLQNWNLTESTAPAVAAFANSTEDVCAVVADKAAYPSPVLAVGSMHSVNACVSNNGTILNVAGMNRILGLEAHGVRAEAGVKLADLHDWLAKDDLEISFSPEIGDATVGSLAVTTSKDSSIDGPGYLSALVNEVKYVDEGGHVVTLSRAKTPTELLAFTCSYGMMGIVVEVVLGVRRRIPISTTAYCVPVKTGQAVASRLAELRTANDAMFAILVPDRSYVYVELRKKTSQLGGMLATNRALSLVATLGENELIKTIMMKTKYNCFLHGDPPSSAMSMLFAANRLPIFHFRSFFVNRYPSVTPGMRRLDFSFVEFDMATFDDVIAGCWEFHHAYKKRTGYAPTGYGIYFVDRGYGAVEGAPRKPTGNFSAPPGVSFMLDPITDDCDNPEWLEFNRDYTAWAVSKGAVPSLSQTKGLVKGQVVLPKALTRSRFLTPFYKEFVA